MNIDEVIQRWVRAVVKHERKRVAIQFSVRDDLSTLLIDRTKVFTTIQRFFSLCQDPDITYRFVEEVDSWIKPTFAAEVSSPWRLWITERLSQYPDYVSGRWEYLDAQLPTLAERVDDVRTILRSGLNPRDPEFHLMLKDRGVREEVISMYQMSWPVMPSVEHRSIFEFPEPY